MTARSWTTWEERLGPRIRRRTIVLVLFTVGFLVFSGIMAWWMSGA